MKKKVHNMYHANHQIYLTKNNNDFLVVRKGNFVHLQERKS